MLVFVYGTLKRGHGNNRLLRTSDYLGKAVSVEKFRMLGGRGVPFVWPDAEGTQHIQGELFDIGEPEIIEEIYNEAARTLAALDRLESNGFVYERAERQFRIIENAHGIMPLPRDAGDVVTAWVYEAMSHIRSRGGRWLADDEAENTNVHGRLEWQYDYVPYLPARHANG